MTKRTLGAKYYEVALEPTSLRLRTKQNPTSPGQIITYAHEDIDLPVGSKVIRRSDFVTVFALCEDGNMRTYHGNTEGSQGATMDRPYAVSHPSVGAELSRKIGNFRECDPFDPANPFPEKKEKVDTSGVKMVSREELLSKAIAKINDKFDEVDYHKKFLDAITDKMFKGFLDNMIDVPVDCADEMIDFLYLCFLWRFSKISQRLGNPRILLFQNATFTWTKNGMNAKFRVLSNTIRYLITDTPSSFLAKEIDCPTWFKFQTDEYGYPYCDPIPVLQRFQQLIADGYKLVRNKDQVFDFTELESSKVFNARMEWIRLYLSKD